MLTPDPELPRAASSTGVRLVRDAAASFGGWLVVSLAFAGLQHAAAVSAGRPSDEVALFAGGLLFGVLWALITLALIQAVRAWPPTQPRLAVFIAGHAVGGLMAAGAHAAAYWALGRALGVAPFERLRDLPSSTWTTELVIYVMVLGLLLAQRQREILRLRTLRQAELERGLAQSRAAMLRAQLQPHFLFNTLNALSELIQSDPAAAERMVARLGDLLRLSLDDTRGAEVTLAQDLAAVDAYLAIEALRLGERLRVERDIAPEALGGAVPDLLLQPLIENAIRHGLAKQRAGGLVRIEARRDGDRLRLAVADDGAGCDPNAVVEGVGLRSARERLRIAADGLADCGLTVRSAPGRGCRIDMVLPWRPL